MSTNSPTNVDFSRGALRINPDAPARSASQGTDLSGVTMVDGVFRYQAGSDQQTAYRYEAPVEPGIRIHTGSGPTRIINGEYDNSSQRFSHNTFHDLVSEGGDYLRTARSPTGSPVSGRPLRNDDIVMIEGIETSVENARRLGLIAENEYGKLVNAAQASDLVKREEPETDPSAHGDAFANPEDEAYLAEASSKTMPGTQVSAINDIVTKGEVTRGTLERLASEAGIEPGEAQAEVAKVHGLFMDQARKVVSEVGPIDFTDFGHWAWKHSPNAIQEAIRSHAMYRQTDGYRALAREYMETMDLHDPHAILEADFGPGVKATKSHDGRVFLDINGKGQVSWRQAVQLGLVKVSPRAR